MYKENGIHSELRYAEKKDPWSSHSIILKWLRGFNPGTKVLDIGTATGMLGRNCVNYGFILKGIEPVPEWAEMARPFYADLSYSNLDLTPDEYIACQDVVVCGDVIEHTPNPQVILERLVSLQKPGTQFFISVPNIANIWIRINLMFGKFDYTENGILDKTHLRFFTKSTFLKLIKNSGIRILELRYTPIPLTRVNPFFQDNSIGRLIHKLFAKLADLLPNLFAYQFVARLLVTDKE